MNRIAIRNELLDEIIAEIDLVIASMRLARDVRFDGEVKALEMVRAGLVDKRRPVEIPVEAK